MSNKFVRKLTASNKDIQKDRVENFAQRAELKHNKIVEGLQERKLDIEAKINELCDLAPKSTTSLTIQDVDPEEWTKELQDLKVKKLEVEVELKIAKETTEEWFSSSDDE